jgi:hypothetical protein
MPRSATVKADRCNMTVIRTQAHTITGSVVAVRSILAVWFQHHGSG